MTALALIALAVWAAPAPAADRPVVETVLLEAATLPEELRLHGTLEPRRRSDLAPQVPGAVTRVAVDVGQRVRAGQPLVQLDPRRYRYQLALRQAELAGAQARLGLATRSLERARALLADSTLSQDGFDRAQFELDAARSQEQMARAATGLAELDLEQSAVVAPFAGEVAAILVEVGEQVAPGRPVVRLAQCDTVEIRAEVSAADLAWLEPGLAVRVEPASGAPFDATLAHLTRVADPVSRRYPIRITAAVADLDLAFGAVASLTVAGRAGQAGVLVPAVALRRASGSTLAYAVVQRDGVTQLQERRVGVVRELPGDRLFVVDGLAPGERLALPGGAPLADGLAVEVADGGRLGGVAGGRP